MTLLLISLAPALAFRIFLLREASVVEVGVQNTDLGDGVDR